MICDFITIFKIQETPTYEHSFEYLKQQGSANTKFMIPYMDIYSSLSIKLFSRVEAKSSALFLGAGTKHGCATL